MSFRSTIQRVSNGGATASSVNNCSLPPVTTFSSSAQPKKLSACTRGGGLRLGKVITDARAVIHPGNAHDDDGPTYTPFSSTLAGPTSGARFIDGDETRVQDEMIEMLTVRLAKKEKETELLRRQQDAHDTQRNQLESHLADLQHELTATRADLSAKVELAQREAQQAHLQADLSRTDAESLRVSLHELRRQRERDGELTRSKELQLQRQTDELRRELAVLRSEKQSLEDRVSFGQQQLDTLQQRADDSEAKRSELKVLLVRAQESAHELAQQLEASRAAIARQEDQQQRLEQEKQSLEEKVQQLSRSLRELTARIGDAERRKSDLTQAEAHLTKQLTQLHRENEELKARNGQLHAQTKQQQTRLATLEFSKATCDARLKDVSEEVSQARKRLREHQFRIQQLQEEIQFLTKKKPTSAIQTKIVTPAKANAMTLREVVANTAAPEKVASDVTAQPDTRDSVPSWMRD